MASKLKELIVAELADKFRDLDRTGCVLVNYEGMKAGQATAVRSSVRQAGGEMTIVRNTLFARALGCVGVEGLGSLLQGPIAVISAENPVDAAKAAKQAAGLCPGLHVRGGYAEGDVIGVAAVSKLADIPSRETLLSMVAGALTAPLRRLAYGLLAKPRALVSAIEQLRDSREGQTE